MPGQLDIFVLGDCPRASGNADVHKADTAPRFARAEEFLTQSKGDVTNVFFRITPILRAIFCINGLTARFKQLNH